MAEIGLIASVIGVAGAGLKLSITLYTFSETVATAADSIKAIAKDVSLTSAVLEELGSNLKHDEQARLYSGTALKTAQTVVVDCEAVFKQIDGALSKSMERISGLSGNGRRKRKGREGSVIGNGETEMAISAAKNARAQGQPGATQKYPGADVECLDVCQESSNKVRDI